MAEASRLDDYETDRRFELLINSVTDYAIYMLDRHGVVASWNPGARRFKGYEDHEIVGHHFSRFYTAEDRETDLPARALRIAAAEGKFEAEGWRVRKDGTRFWAHVVVDPIRSEGGDVIGYAKITRDITQRRADQQALFDSEQRFRILVQGVRDYAIYMLDPEGVVSNWNTGAEAIKGYKADEIVGQHFSRFYTDEDRARGEPQRALSVALSEGKYEMEAWRLRKDGTRFWASVVIDPIQDDQGRLIGFAKITRDMTERRRAQEELEEARAALFQSQKMQALGELTGGIAHDFNNLMTVIRGSADLLRRGDLAEERRERYLQAIIETADRAATLTSHLLAFGRRQALKPEVLDLNVRLDALGEVLGRTLESQVDLKLDLAPGIWPAEVDATQFETALLNAAFNARDAMPGGGTLTLSTRNFSEREGDMVCVAIADTGEGMPDEVIQRAFEPFFTTKPVGKGTGLGLSQIHGFAAQSGGRAEIRSKAGEGTTISLFLPRSAKRVSAHGQGDGQVAAVQGGRILLVEDNDHVRTFAGQLLEDLGFDVVAASSGEEALALIKAEAVDLVFSDVVMPGISGVQLAEAIARSHPELPVLLASGHSDEIVAGVEGTFGFLRKPYHAATLSAALNEALRPSKRAAG